MTNAKMEWAFLDLQYYQFVVEQKCGKDNANADGLPPDTSRFAPEEGERHRTTPKTIAYELPDHFVML